VLRPSGSQQTIDAIAFKTVEQFPQLPEKLKIAYQLDINEWQGRQSLQLRIDYMEAVA
jgi:single-stranded-DNA-specific exonuclease